MKFLALDIGTRRTGVAYLDTEVGIPLPLTTLQHGSVKELLSQVTPLLSARRIDRVIVGLPTLPSGEEGSQAEHVRKVVELLSAHHGDIRLVDERYSTPRTRESDPDAAAACALLSGL